MRPEVAEVARVLRNEIGVREIGRSNTGPRVREYQAATTLGGTNWPWCAALLAFGFKTALGEALARTVWLPSASCDDILDWARRRGIVSSDPAPGCAGLVMASRNDATHIFLVSEVRASGVVTIEGNSNDEGSREGYEVCSNRRPFSKRYLYILWEKLLPSIIEDKFQTPIVVLCDSSGREIDKLPVFEGRAYVAAWKWAKWMNAPLGWNAAMQSVTLAGREVPSQPRIIDGRAWLPIRVLADFSGLEISYEPGKVRIAK